MIVFMDIYISIGLALLGAVLGSFAGAQVWRLRAHQLKIDKAAGEPYSKVEYSRLKGLMGRKQLQDRSECLNCGHRLNWQDMLPVVSWLSLAGKCRYCKKPIGYFELAIELAMGALFVVSYLAWPLALTSWAHWGLFALWLAIVVVLVILAAYDYKWQLLPDVLNYSFMGLALVFLLLKAAMHPELVNWLSVAGSVGVLSGLYAALYVVSRGNWIGLGDVKLGVGLALLLGDWKLAFLALFLANLIGCLLVLPGIIKKSLNHKSRIAFGPLLMAGTLLAFWWGHSVIGWLFGQNLLFI